MSKIKSIHILYVLFLVSILIRWPNLNRPLSKHHEFNTAFFLIPMEIWSENGGSSHGFLPPYNYSNPGDFHVVEPIAIESGEKEGRFYYLSLPPLSYIVPYALFNVFGLEFSPLNLQLFNLLLHVLVIFFLYKILKLSYAEHHAFWAVLFYLFAPGPLWFHGNGYTHHVFAILPLLSAIYFLLKYVHSDTKNVKHRIVFAISSAALVYSEWIGVFFLFTVLIVSILNYKNKPFRQIAWTSLFVGLISIGALLCQYISFMGWEQYKTYMLDRFLQRSGIDSENANGLNVFARWAYWSIVSFGLWVPCISIGLLMFFKSKISLLPKEKFTIKLLIVPVLLYHFIFNEFTFVHEYSVMYNGIIWVFLTALILNFIEKSFVNGVHSFISIPILFLFVVQYYYINRIGEVGQNGDRYDQLMEIGYTIRDHAMPDETVFLHIPDESLDRVNPIVVYYAKRNFVPIRSLAELDQTLVKLNNSKAMILNIEQGEITDIWRKQIGP